MFNRIPLTAKLLLVLFLATAIVSACFSMSDMSSMPGNDGLNKGEKIFKANCAGCHLNGQNLIKADKPVIGSTKLQSKPVFKKFLESPPKPMPEYKNITSMDTQLDSLYSYLITLMNK